MQLGLVEVAHEAEELEINDEDNFSSQNIDQIPSQRPLAQSLLSGFKLGNSEKN